MTGFVVLKKIYMCVSVCVCAREHALNLALFSQKNFNQYAFFLFQWDDFAIHETLSNRFYEYRI